MIKICVFGLNVITDETQTNEYLVEDYKITQSTDDALSISVKRFYKNVS